MVNLKLMSKLKYLSELFSMGLDFYKQQTRQNFQAGLFLLKR